MKRFMLLILLIAFTAEAQQAGEPKNVQILTGLTELELQRTMNFIRASLGVHCDYCHVVEKGKGWQWEKDDKKKKLRAREMIRMVMEINKTHFKGLPIISCNTCHQGHIKPQGLPSLPQAPPTFPTAVPSTERLPEVKTVLEKYYAAIGGDPAKEKAAGVTIRKGVRESYDRVYIETSISHLAPDKWLMKSKSIDETVTRGYDGKSAWIILNEDKPREMKQGEKERFFELIRDFEIIPARLNDPDLVMVEQAKVGDKEAYVVKTGWKDSTQERFFFDADSGLLVKRMILRQSRIGLVPEQIVYDSYQDLQGWKLPFQVSPAYVDPWIGTPFQFTEIQWEPVDPRLFDMPAGNP